VLRPCRDQLGAELIALPELGSMLENFVGPLSVLVQRGKLSLCKQHVNIFMM